MSGTCKLDLELEVKLQFNLPNGIGLYIIHVSAFLCTVIRINQFPKYDQVPFAYVYHVTKMRTTWHYFTLSCSPFPWWLRRRWRRRQWLGLLTTEWHHLGPIGIPSVGASVQRGNCYIGYLSEDEINGSWLIEEQLGNAMPISLQTSTMNIDWCQEPRQKVILLLPSYRPKHTNL